MRIDTTYGESSGLGSASRYTVGTHVVADMLATIGQWSARARQRRQLVELTPDRLKDIGVTRAEAGFEARKPFWRK